MMRVKERERSRDVAGMSDLDALKEMLGASLALCMQLDELEVAEHVVEAVRVLQDKNRKAQRDVFAN